MALPFFSLKSMCQAPVAYPVGLLCSMYGFYYPKLGTYFLAVMNFLLAHPLEILYLGVQNRELEKKNGSR